MSFALYDDQADLVAAGRQVIANGARAPLFVLPTGGGKTVIFSWLSLQMARRRKRVAILSHRQELQQQISDTLTQFGVSHTGCAPGLPYDPREPVMNGSVFTVARRLDRVQLPDAVIIDEGHHAVEGSTYANIIEFWRKHKAGLITMGFTATPERLDGSGLNWAYDALVEGLTTAELISMGRLADYKLFAPPQALDVSGLHIRGGDYRRDEAEQLMNRPTITGNAIQHYKKLLNGAPAVAFCVSRKHAQATAEDFRAHGWRAAHIDGSMKPHERRMVNEDFAAGRLNVMTSCDLISEGYDVPGMMGAILLRPTMSLALYLQQVGRALRKADGKEHAIILDHVGNSARHGLPDARREWSLEGRNKVKRADVERDIQIRVCDACGAVSPATATKCGECGKVFKLAERKIEEVEGELQEVDKEAAKVQFKNDRAAARDIEALVEIGRMRGMKNPHGWARHVMEARAKKKEQRHGHSRPHY